MSRFLALVSDRPSKNLIIFNVHNIRDLSMPLVVNLSYNLWFGKKFCL